MNQAQMNVAKNEMIDLLLNICGYIVTDEVVLHDGETIGFTEEQR